MATIIKSISCTQEENDFCELYNLSPTFMFKAKISEMRSFLKTAAEEKITKLVAQVAALSEENARLRDKT